MTIQDVRSNVADLGLELSDRIPAPRTVEPEAEAPIVGPHGGPLRVLVVGINYGPEHTGIAPYTTQLSEYLAERGASVTTFTGVPHYPSWSVESEYRRRLRRTEVRNGVHVRRLRHYVPKTQSALRRGLYELTFALQVAVQRPTEQPDVVLAVVPSLLSAVVARRIAARAGVPLVVWLQDLMGQAAKQSGMNGGDRVACLVASVEKHVLQHANQVLVLNSHFADYVESIAIDKASVTVCPNWTHVATSSNANRHDIRARLGWQPNETIVLHTGNMGLKQDLSNVVAAAKLADQRPDNNVKFVLMGDGSQRKTLQREADRVAAIQFLPPAPCEEYVEVLAAADILLVNERSSSIDMSLPSKLTSYLRAGRPIVAACTASGGTAVEVKRSAAGIVVEPNRPDALLETVDGLATNPEAATIMSTLGRKYAEENLNADVALRTLLAAILSKHQTSTSHPACDTVVDAHAESRSDSRRRRNRPSCG